MKILFATNNSYLPQNVGGSELSTHDLCTSLRVRGNDVGVLCTIDRRGWLGLKNRCLRKLKGIEFPVDHVMGYPVYRGWDPGHMTGQVIEQFKPDVVVIQAIAPMKLARVFVDAGIKTIVYLRDVCFERLGGTVFSDSKLAYLANSHFTGQRFYETFALHAEAIPPLIDYGKYATKTTGERVVFVCPYPEKGVEIAFSLAEARPDIPFDFVESWELGGSWLQQLNVRAASLGNVRIVRRVLDMRDIYSSARIVLMPSKWEEAWGRVVSEAQVSGIPALASNTGGLPESVGDGGILVDPQAPLADWVQALATLWDDREQYRYYSERARACSQRAELQPSVIVERLMDVFTRHCTSPTRCPVEGA